LLVLVLARLFNYIPDAGLWMNTQRPEWNDANNALVGSGVSMVTLYFLRRFVSFSRVIFRRLGTNAGDRGFLGSRRAFRRVAEALERHMRACSAGPSRTGTASPCSMIWAAPEATTGQGFTRTGFQAARRRCGVAELDAFCDVALRHIDHSIRANRREDGLYHAYNLMKVSRRRRQPAIVIRRLYEMLEGQMAVLSSGALDARESAALLDALRSSRLYRADQNSYLLYPDRKLPGFFEKNNIPASAIAQSKPLADMIERGDRRIVVQDANGVAHFNAAFRNSAHLLEALSALHLPAEETARILACMKRCSITSPSPAAPARSTSTRDSAAFTGTWFPSCCWQCRRCWTGPVARARTLRWSSASDATITKSARASASTSRRNCTAPSLPIPTPTRPDSRECSSPA
jgi:hypothetical protein